MSLYLNINSYSQNIEPSQRTFNIGGYSTPQTISSTHEYFNINKFILGWHWGDEYKISKALKMNQKDIYSGSEENINPDTKLFIRSKYNKTVNGETIKYSFSSHCYFDKSHIFGKSLKYEPTLYIDPNNVYKLNKRDKVGDPSNPVFGFLTKRGTITNDPNDPNNNEYSRVIIRGDSLVNQVVLSNPWPNDIMYYTPKQGDNNDEDTQKDFSGRSFFVSINLRKYKTISTLSPDTPILKIRVPYTTWTSATQHKDDNYAYFRGVPASGFADYTTLPGSYGKAWNLDLISSLPSRPQFIYITEKMLPIDGSSITISGYIDFAGFQGPNTYTNHILKEFSGLKDGENYKSSWGVNGQKIDKLNLEVTYLNSGTEVAIDWVKFETPNAKKINCGYYDDNIAESVQGDLTHFHDYSNYASIGIKPTRWIVHDEGSAVNWEAERHFRKIVGNVTTGAVGPSLGAHWDEYLGNADKWIEVSSVTTFVANPYLTTNFSHLTATALMNGTETLAVNSNYWKTLGMKQGCIYNDYPSPSKKLDRFNSEYETFIRETTAIGTVEYIRNTLSIDEYTSNDNYLKQSQGKTSFQTFWEWSLYEKFINPYNSGFAFSEKPWFGQHFVQEFLYEEEHFISNGGIKEQINSYHLEPLKRFQTAEETSLFLWNPLIMGAKGLMYDGGKDYSFIAGSNGRRGQIKLLPEESEIISRYKTLLNNNAFSQTDLYDLPEDEFLNSSELTGDFLNNKYDHIPFIPKLVPLGNTVVKDEMLDEIAKNMGAVKKDGITEIKERIYIGKRSQRNKLFEVHNWVRENDEELMNLKLMAWYGKGYKIWEKPEPTELNPSIISKFIDKGKITTRKLYNASVSGNQANITYKNGVPNYQLEANTNEDFVDVTLLERKVIPTGDTKKIFYVGVQNRRTDPTIYFTEDTDDKHLLFLSYSEFQDMCKKQGDSKNPLRNELTDLSYPASKWQEYWWKKLGCREINIPFDYKNVGNDKDHYNLLKVEELDGEYKENGALIPNIDLPFHLQSAYNHKVDTVLGQDGILRLKLQPGQGKILRVTVLEPDLTTNGELDHSNQTKLVAFPLLNQDGTESDKIQYHMVYYKNNPLCSNQRSVYYRRSKPIKKSDGKENIEWGEEKVVSNNIRNINNNPGYKCNATNLVDNPNQIYYDCDYPSIVVRKDGPTTIKAYIVYSCENIQGENFYNAFIGLAVLDVSNEYIVSQNSNNVYDYYNTTVINGIAQTSEFGNPVINASANYNFIAFSDLNNNIVASYMYPNETKFAEFLSIKNETPLLDFGYNINSYSQHPSLNSYSKISAGEDNCSLVWQQKNYGLNSSVFYTRLRVNNDNLIKYNYDNTKVLMKDNIVKLNNSIGDCSFPVILKDLKEFNYNTGSIVREDIIYWAEEYRFSFLNLYRSTIVGTSIVNIDNKNPTYNPINLRKTNEFRINDVSKSISQPNISLPHGVVLESGIKFNKGTHILNFSRGNIKNYASYLPNSNNTSYHLPLITGFFSGINNINYSKTTLPVTIASNTDQVHLAQHKENNYYDKVWRNRRIYEESNFSPPRIVSNGKYFYKNNVEEKLESEPFVGFRKNSNDYSVSNPYINNQEVGLALPYIPNTDTTGAKMILDFAQDTIFSNWFDVNTVADLNFKCYGFNDTIMVAKIQKQSDNSFINLNLPLSTTDTTGKLGEYTLINGGLSSYRLCFIRLDTNYQYTETLVLDGLPVSDTVMLKGAGDTKNIIDLSGNFNLTMNNDYFDIAISPNPANDIVYMTPLYNDLKNQNLVEVEILDNLGNSIHKKVVKSGETFSFITSELSQGIYVVNCKEVTSDWLAPSFLKATKFVVNR